MENIHQNEDESSITFTISLSEGDLSHSAHVLQGADIDMALNDNGNDDLFVPKLVPPVQVNGNMPALNIDNFQVLGEGLQNLMLAYQRS
jgi:hypothetical protein